MPAPPLAPLQIPRSIPTPLPDDLRLSIKAHLVREKAIPEILDALNRECGKEGWEGRLRARVLQLVRERGGNVSRGEVVARIVGEARGIVDGDGDGEGGKAVDVRVSEKAVGEGARVVGRVLDRVGELEAEGRDWWDR